MSEDVIPHDEVHKWADDFVERMSRLAPVTPARLVEAAFYTGLTTMAYHPAFGRVWLRSMQRMLADLTGLTAEQVEVKARVASASVVEEGD